MKGAIVVLVFLQLVIPNEGKLSKVPKKILDSGKNCPRHQKLAAFKKALGLLVSKSRLQKRTLSFPIDCWHAAIFEDGGVAYFHSDLHECCQQCDFPDFYTCLLNGYADWLCASRAYQCLCECREAHLVGQYAAKTSSAAPTQKKKPVISASNVCVKTCAYPADNCCNENVCIKIFFGKKKSFVKP